MSEVPHFTVALRFESQDNDDADGVAVVTHISTKRIQDLAFIARENNLLYAAVLDDSASMLEYGEFWENSDLGSCIFANKVPETTIAYTVMYVSDSGKVRWVVVDDYTNEYETAEWTLMELYHLPTVTYERSL